MKKQSFEKCVFEYSDTDLCQFHSNLLALDLCCAQNFNLHSLIISLMFEISKRESKYCQKYLASINSLLKK